jgi:serine protease
MLSGRLTVVAAVPLSLAPDTEPNDSAVSARRLQGTPEGRLDADVDPVDVFRVVARRPGSVTAVLEAEGLAAEVVLHDLASGVVARTLDVARGTVYDVVVTARDGAGSYRVRLVDDGADRAPRALPEAYRECGQGHAEGEIVAAPLPGVSPEALAAATGLMCVGGSESLCLLARPTPAANEFAGLCDLLASCARLETDGWVRYAEPNYRRRLAGNPDDPLLSTQWGLEQIRAPAAWEHIVATSHIVAVVDSGIRQHPDLVDQLVPGYDFEGGDPDPTDTNRSFSHGTQTAGIVAASGNNGVGISGVFWDGKVMPLRAFDAAGFGTSFNISNAILFAAGLPNSSGTVPPTPAVAINLSFASTTRTAAEEDACNAARAAGLVIAAAAGNDSSSAVHYPAGYDSVMAVAATNRAGAAAGYSNFGTWIDLAAPGGTQNDGVRTTGVDSQAQFTYPYVDGTSFACPHVAAVAAMLMTLADLTPDEVEQILVTTAQDVGDDGYDVRTGFGILDAYGAVLAALDETPPLLFYEEVEVRLLRFPERTVVMSETTTGAQQLQWTLGPIAAGRYLLEAGTDRDLDGDISDPGEVFGRWRDATGDEVLVVEPGQSRTDLDFTVQPQ